MTRVILYTGKGGVGKTSVAAATAVRAADQGYRTIVISTDAAHSLADSFDVTLGSEPQLLAPNLWGQEAEINETMERYWGTIRDWISALFEWRGMNEIVADEMAVLPGMEELANLLYIVAFVESGDYDAVVVDCAPTGETLRLLSFPEVVRWWMEKLFPIERKAAKVLRPVIRPLLHVPIPGEEVFDAAETLFFELNKMREILSNPETSSVRLVVNAEKMVIKETQRTFTYLNLYGYPTDLVVCNRLLPDEVGDAYFGCWKESQSKYFGVIEESFAPLPILSLPFLDREIVGLSMLRRAGEALFGDKDPTSVYFTGRPHEIEKQDGHYVLRLPLPFVSKEDLTLTHSGRELVVQAGRHRRNIFLPSTLVGMEIEGARFEDGKLHIRFRR